MHVLRSRPKFRFEGRLRFDGRVRWLATLAAGSALVAVLPAAPAGAASGAPAVGECYRITDKQTYDDNWPGGVAPVPCSGTHSMQITQVHELPADVNAANFAEQQCDYLSVWSDLGINQAVDGIVARPLRIESFFFVLSQPGIPASWVCGAGPVAFRGSDAYVLTSMRGAIDALTAKQKAALQFCSSAAHGRGTASPITVPCTARPRWQVTKWIMWDDFYGTYPGQAVLAKRAAAMCGPGTTQSVPTAKDWPGGTHRSWCYRKIG
jgi:hypothetical protein